MLSKLILKYLVKLPPIVIERLARKGWSYEEYIHAKMLEEGTTDLLRFYEYNRNTFKRKFRRVAFVEEHDWQLFYDQKRKLQ